jgi:hypothetical protein
VTPTALDAALTALLTPATLLGWWLYALALRAWFAVRAQLAPLTSGPRRDLVAVGQLARGDRRFALAPLPLLVITAALGYELGRLLGLRP